MPTTTQTWADVVEYLHSKKENVEKDDVARFKQRAYSILISKIRQRFDLSHKATCADVEDMDDVTKHMKEELCKFLRIAKRTPKRTSKRVSTSRTRPKAQPKTQLKSQLMRIPGIGESKAIALIETGLQSVADLLKDAWFKQLPEETKVHLKHTPEDRIPHEHIAELEPTLVGFDPKNTIVAGSYRRKMPYSRDIDVVLVSDAPNALDRYLDYLKKHLGVWVYSKGRDKMSFVIGTGRLMREPHMYKLDVFRTTPDERWSMVLYLTGSKAFNIRMRSRAMRLGYLLNQNGLFDQGRRIPISSEKGYFDALSMEWVPPEQRF